MQNKYVYSIMDGNTCICDGYNRAKVVADAEEFFKHQSGESFGYGDGEIDVELCTYNRASGQESVQPLTISWEGEYEESDYQQHNVWHSQGGGVL